MRLFGQHKGKVLPGAKSPFLGRLWPFCWYLIEDYIAGWHGAVSAPCILSVSSSGSVSVPVPVPVPGCPNRSCNRFRTVS